MNFHMAKWHWTIGLRPDKCLPCEFKFKFENTKLRLKIFLGILLAVNKNNVPDTHDCLIFIVKTECDVLFGWTVLDSFPEELWY